MRKTIARRTVQSKQTIPHFYLTMPVEMDKALVLLDQLNASTPDQKITINDLIVKAAYSIDGGEWVPIFPDDGLFDSPSETISLPLPDLKPGTHVLMVRATDAAGNLGTGDLVISGR